MLVTTNALVWTAQFGILWFIVPAILFAVLLTLELTVNRNSKTWGIFGVLSIISIVFAIAAFLVWGLTGNGPRSSELSRDIEQQTSISSIRWENKPAFTGENEQGQFVKCAYFKTNKETVVEIICDK